MARPINWIRSLPSIADARSEDSTIRESEARTIWRHGRVYGFGTLINRGAAFLLVPVLMHALSPEEWGVYALTLAVGHLIIIAPHGIIDTNARLYFDQKDEAGRRRVVGTIFVAFLVAACLIAVLTYPFALAACEILFGHREHLLAFVIGMFSAIFQLMFDMELDFLRVRKRAKLFVGFSLLRSLLQFGLSILFVVGLGMGVTGVVLGSLLAGISVAVPVAAMFLARTGIPFDKGLAREMTRQGLPLIPAWLAKGSLELIERYLLNLLMATASLGIYVAGQKVSEQLRNLVAGPIWNITAVRLLEIGESAERTAEFSRAQVYVAFVMVSAGLGLALFGAEIIRIIAAEEFWGAAVVIPIFALTELAYQPNAHFETALIQRKKTIYLPVINWGTLAVGVAALFLLVPEFGIVGAAFGFLLAQVFRLVCSVWFAARCSDYVRLYPWASHAMICALAAGVYFLSGALTRGEVSVENFFVKAGLLAAFITIALYSPAFRAEERRALQRYLFARLPLLRRGRQTS